MNVARDRQRGGGELRLLIALILGLLLGVGLLELFRSSQRDPPPPELRTTAGSTDRRARADPAPRRGTTREDVPGSEARGRAGGDLPASVRPLEGAVLWCLDAENRGPIAGVRAWDTQQSRNVGISDDEGRLDLERTAAGFLILHQEGCLATLLPRPVQTALAERNEAEVEIYRDRLSIALDVRAVWPPEHRSSQPFSLLLVPLDPAPETGFPQARLAGRAMPRELRQAWEKHRLLVSQVRQPGSYWHLGKQLLPYRMPPDGGRVLCAEDRAYQLRAYAAPGLYARQEIRLRAHGPNAAVLRFQRGSVMRFRVLGVGGAPLAGARVQLVVTDADQEQLQRTTSGGGLAAFDGLVPGDPIRVTVTAEGYERHEAVLQVAATEHAVQLAQPAFLQHTIVVREKKSRKPVRGVAATVGNPLQPVARIESDAAGMLRLRLVKGEQRLLTLRKEGFLEYQEMLDPSDGPLPSEVEIVPQARERQLSLGLIGAVTGVIREQGKPLAGAVVTLTPWMDDKGRLADDSMPALGFVPLEGPIPKRRLVIRGLRPKIASRAITDAEGRFELYSESAGRAHVVWLSTARGGGKREVWIVLGKRTKVQF